MAGELEMSAGSALGMNLLLKRECGDRAVKESVEQVRPSECHDLYAAQTIGNMSELKEVLTLRLGQLAAAQRGGHCRLRHLWSLSVLSYQYIAHKWEGLARDLVIHLARRRSICL